MPTLRDITGKKFHLLKVIGHGAGQSPKAKYWECVCECGKVVIAKAIELRNSHIISCSNPICKEKALGLRGKLPPRGGEPHLYSLKTKFRNYKASAKSRGYEFKLTIAEGIELFTSNCHYCGSPPEITTKYGPPRNGIDRINNKIGYITGNIVSCCKTCNKMKNTLHVDDFIDHIRKINSHLSKPP